MGTSQLKKKTKGSKKDISTLERANDSIKRSLSELACIFRGDDESDTSLDEEELLSMAVDYLKMAAATENVTGTKRPREEKEDKWATRKKRKSRSMKKRSKTKEAAPTPSASQHDHTQTGGGNAMCWESALEGYVTGYKDCSQEAVRYLLEEEGLTPTDQIVIGLRNHLRDNEVSVIDNNNRRGGGGGARSAESLVGQTLVCYNPRTSAGLTPPSPAVHQLPPIHELMSTSMSAFPVPSSSMSSSSTASSNSLPHGSMTALTIATTPLSVATTPESMVALSNGRTMEPLTVDTNQEYELPSPLQRGAEAAKKSKESLLTIAHTHPTVSRPIYTQSVAAHHYAPVTLTAQTMPLAMSCATQRLGMEKAMATNSVVGGNTFGFNLNYAAPYVYAWVKPAQ